MTNSELFFQIYNLAGHNLLVDKLMIFGAKELIFVAFFVCFLLILFGGPKERRSFLSMITSLMIALLLVQITHFFFYETRPYLTLNLTPLIKHTPDAAFPSQHTTMMAVVAGAYLFNKSKYAGVFILAMLWVGFARIFVGLHYPLDILAGIIYGFFANFLTILINKKIKLF